MSPRRTSRTPQTIPYPGGLVAACALLSAVVFLFIMLNLGQLQPWYSPLGLLLWFWLIHLFLHVFGLLAVVLKWPPFPWLLQRFGLVKVYRKHLFLLWYLLFTLYVGGYVLYESAWAVYWTVG